MYQSTLQVVKENVKDLDAVGLQLDHWTSTAQYPFGNMYATWISADYKLHNVNLGTFSFKATDEPRHIFKSLEGSDCFVEKYDLQKSYRIYVTDLASNCKAAFDSEENIQWLGCFSLT